MRDEQAKERRRRGEIPRAEPRVVALLALESLSRYAAEVAQDGDTLHEDMALRLAQVASRNKW